MLQDLLGDGSCRMIDVGQPGFQSCLPMPRFCPGCMSQGGRDSPHMCTVCGLYKNIIPVNCL